MKSWNSKQLKLLPMVRREMKNRHLFKADIARLLQIKPTSVEGMFSRSTMQVQRLADLSDAMEYNFFRELALQFSYELPKEDENPVIKNLQDKLLALEERNKELEIENRVLQQALKVVSGK